MNKSGEADPKVSFCFFWGVREVQEDNNGKLNPSHFVGPVHKATGGHGFPYVTLLNYSCTALNKIAILLIFKGIAIAFVGKFCYI